MVRFRHASTYLDTVVKDRDNLRKKVKELESENLLVESLRDDIREFKQKIEELGALLDDVHQTIPSEECGVYPEISVVGRLTTEEWFACRDRLLRPKEVTDSE